MTGGGGPGPPGGARPAASRVALEVRAELDPPGETGRQARIFAIWAACLALAVVIGSIAGRVSPGAEGMPDAAEALERARRARARAGLLVGLVLPAVLTWVVHRRYRRGGPHARGIVVDVTDDGELRIWGRGYGSRLSLRGATIVERLVDVYAGRLGAWRQRRLRVRGRDPSRGGFVEIELATPAVEADAREVERVEGGEGDCVELERSDFERVRARVLEAIAAPEP